MSGRIWAQFRSMELAQRGIMVGPSIVQYNDSPHGWCLACWVHLAFWTFKRRAHQQNQFNFTFSKGRYLHWQAYNTNQVFNGNQGSQDSSDSQCFTFASLNQLLKKRKYLQTSKKPILEKRLFQNDSFRFHFNNILLTFQSFYINSFGMRKKDNRHMYRRVVQQEAAIGLSIFGNCLHAFLEHSGPIDRLVLNRKTWWHSPDGHDFLHGPLHYSCKRWKVCYWS